MNLDSRFKEDWRYPKGINFFEALTLIFITLKLTGYIDWTWVWVLSPIWIGFVLIMLFLACAGLSGDNS